MSPEQDMSGHFSELARGYNQARTTDVAPIAFIAETLGDLPEVRAADVGCGAGRYDLLLLQHIGNLHLTLIDNNDSMLGQVSDYLLSHGVSGFETVRADANEAPLRDGSLDCIFTFNAIHHFDFLVFVKKCAKALKEGGRVFIYTRSRRQNDRSIWGRYFPSFSQKETRLYDLDEMDRWAHSVDQLELEAVKTFKYKRNASLERLVEQVEARHYSTFCLYENGALDEALRGFQENIKRDFPDTEHIEWLDGNVLLTLRRRRG